MSERIDPGVIDKLRKILARSEKANCTKAEAETAFKMAARLMAEHNLSMDDIKLEQAEDFIEEAICETSRWSLEDNLAFTIVKEFFFIEGMFGHNASGQKVLNFFGKPSNIEAAKFAFRSLYQAFDRHWTIYRVVNRATTNQRRLFIAGMAKGFTDKMRAERTVVEIERDIVKGSSGSTALALRNIADETKNALTKKYPKHTTTKSNFTAAKGDQATLDAGYKAGQKLSLNRAITVKE